MPEATAPPTEPQPVYIKMLLHTVTLMYLLQGYSLSAAAVNNPIK